MNLRIHRDSILSLELPYRERLEIRRTVFQGGDGPRVGIVSGIHGDELEGLYVCHRLAAWLEDLAKTRPEALLGTVELYPGLNPLGLETLQRLVPVFDTDLNRNFPGHPEGLMPQRIADAAMKSLKGCALVLDIHASNIFLREIPQVRIASEFAANLVPLARKMNLNVIWVHGAMTVLATTLSHSLNSANTPCLVVEMGVGMRITPHFIDQLFAGILNAWKDLGVLAPDLPVPPVTHSPLLADDSNVHYANAAASGLFVPAHEHWKRLKKGDLLGRVVSPHQGAPLSEVRSPVDGILFTLREYPLVYEGSLMARIVEAS
ncbi:MAG TPA: M14 family metallopeptidase [bacterium]|nr:M14 family metallopeptidase [bacterium]